MELGEVLELIDTLTNKIRFSHLSTLSLFKISDQLKLDWGFNRDLSFADEYNEGATQSILLKSLSNYDHPLNARQLGSSKNEVILSLVESFMTNNYLTKEKLNKIHSLIIKNGGRYRNENISVHSALSPHTKFNFSHPANIDADLEKLVRWYNTNKDRIDYHPVFLAAEFHYRFIIIHPYLDGNGRLARIISSMILLNNKIPPPIFFNNERNLYISRLRRADEGDLESWCQLIAERIIRSQDLLIKEII